MGRMRKWLDYIPDRISGGMRYVCERMSPDVRLIVVVAVLVGFSALSVYITVSSIYNIGRREGERIRIERMRQLELHPGTAHDSINNIKDWNNGRNKAE